MKTYCGTPLNMAPEIMNHQIYNYKVDIWSIGILLFYILTGTYPFFSTTKQDLLLKVRNGQYKITTQETLRASCIDFINNCL